VAGDEVPAERIAQSQAFSRLSSRPGSFKPTEQASVSPETSYSSTVPCRATTVRHTPLWAMLSPRRTSSSSSARESTAMCTPSASGVTVSTRPMPITIPVNMAFSQIGKEGILRESSRLRVKSAKPYTE